MALDIIRLIGSLSVKLVVHNGTRNVVVKRNVRCGTLNFIKESKVRESTLLANNPLKRLNRADRRRVCRVLRRAVDTQKVAGESQELTLYPAFNLASIFGGMMIP